MDNKVFSNILSNQAGYIEELKTFCKQPSVASKNIGMKEMHDMVLKKLNGIGAITQSIVVNNSFPYILAELNAPVGANTKKTVLIYNHYDVQPEDPLDEWESAPFDPTIKDGKLYARGVSDNKANLLFRIQAIKNILDTTGDLPVNIKWLIEGEEEIGSINMHYLQEKHGDFWKDCDVCVWETGGVNEDNAPELKLGMKGVLYVELSCEFNKLDLHSGYACIADSPVWRLVHALATIRDVTGNVTVDGMYDNAIYPTQAESQLIVEKVFDPHKFSNEIGIEKTLKSNEDKNEFVKQMYFTATANICGIWAGYTEPKGVKTVLPKKATAKLDFRLIKNQTTNEILDKLRKHLDQRGFDDINIDVLVNEEAGKSSIENPYIKKCYAVFEEYYKTKPTVIITSLGSGPIYYIASIYDIPVVNIGAEYAGCKPHAPNENIRLKDYEHGMTVFTKYLFELGNL